MTATFAPAASPSRLRAPGRTRRGTLAAAAVAASAVAALSTAPAPAAVIYSGSINGAVNGAQTLPVNIDSTGVSEFTLTSGPNAKSGSVHTLTSLSSDFRFLATTATDRYPLRLTQGATIDGAGVFSAAANAAGVATVSFSQGFTGPNWGPSLSGYMGFTFNPSGTLPLYGWAQVSISATGLTMTMVDYAYETSGAPLAAGLIPEPASSGLLLLGLGVLGRRRRRRGAG